MCAQSSSNAQVAGFLFNAAKNGNVTAQIFWLKTRARWREVPVELKHSGSIERKDLNQISDQELVSLISALGTQIGFTRTAALETTQLESANSSSGLMPAQDRASRLVLPPNTDQHVDGHASHDPRRS